MVGTCTSSNDYDFGPVFDNKYINRTIERYQRSKYIPSLLKIKKTAAEIVKQEQFTVMCAPGVHSFGHRPDGKLIVRTSLPRLIPDSIEGITVVKEYCEGFIGMCGAIPAKYSFAKVAVEPNLLDCNKIMK